MKESKATRKNAAFFAIFLIGCAAFIFFINEQKIEIPMRPVTDQERVNVSGGTKIDHRATIQTYAQQAATRNMNAIKSFELEIQRINSLYERKFRNATVKAAEDASEISSCIALTYYMAWDKITSDHEAENYIEGSIRPHMYPLAQDFAREINAAMRALDADLHRSTLLLAKDLYAETKVTQKDRPDIGKDALNYQKEMEVALRNLALNAASALVSIAFDGVALWNSHIFQSFCGVIIQIANSVFGSSIAAMISSGTVAIADGLLPIGDIIALIGVGWTAYDIYSGRQEFEDNLHRSLENAVVDAVSSAHTEAVQRASELLKEYQDFQDKAGASALEAVMGGEM